MNNEAFTRLLLGIWTNKYKHLGFKFQRRSHRSLEFTNRNILVLNFKDDPSKATEVDLTYVGNTLLIAVCINEPLTHLLLRINIYQLIQLLIIGLIFAPSYFSSFLFDQELIASSWFEAFLIKYSLTLTYISLYITWYFYYAKMIII